MSMMSLMMSRPQKVMISWIARHRGRRIAAMSKRLRRVRVLVGSGGFGVGCVCWGGGGGAVCAMTHPAWILCGQRHIHTGAPHADYDTPKEEIEASEETGAKAGKKEETMEAEAKEEVPAKGPSPFDPAQQENMEADTPVADTEQMETEKEKEAAPQQATDDGRLQHKTMSMHYTSVADGLHIHEARPSSTCQQQALHPFHCCSPPSPCFNCPCRCAASNMPRLWQTCFSRPGRLMGGGLHALPSSGLTSFMVRSEHAVLCWARPG